MGQKTPENVVGKEDFAIAIPEQARGFRARDREVIETGKPLLGYEELRSMHDGRDVWLRTSKVPLLDGEGRLCGILGVYEDTTERRRAQTELLESHERLLTVLNSLDAAIYIADMKDHEILFVNQHGTGKWGRNLVGAKCWRAIQRQSGPCPFCTNGGLVAANGEPTGVHQWEAQSMLDGRWYDLRDCAIRWTDGRLVHMQVATDISDRKQAEHLLAAKNKELEQIVYVASHDLRSPLVNVDGYGREIEYSLEELGEALAADSGRKPDMGAVLRTALPAMTDALHHIRNSARQMDTLLKGLLKISRSGRAALSIGPVDMNAVVSQVVAGLEFQVRESGAAVRVGDLPPCLGDAIQLTQVFQNLVGNALKFLSPARPGTIEVSGSVEHDRSVYCVEDNGVGIAPEHQSIIFELFHRLDPRHTEGEGLGLTIVRQTLSRLGGEVWVESGRGAGSRFYVSLPGIQQDERN
jgi:signal transduction histidine kinase